jgi:hypothetical protein
LDDCFILIYLSESIRLIRGDNHQNARQHIDYNFTHAKNSTILVQPVKKAAAVETKGAGRFEHFN